MYEAAKALVDTGPPFRLEDTPLDGHCVYLTEHEAVFVFEGPEARAAVETISATRRSGRRRPHGASASRGSRGSPTSPSRGARAGQTRSTFPVFRAAV